MADRLFYWIKGRVEFFENAFVYLSSGNLGYEIYMGDSSEEMLPDDHQEIQLYVDTVLRENEFYLVGFFDQEERNLYRILLGVSKIGPKQAIRMIRDMGVHDIRMAVVQEDQKRLSGIKGIGAKTASRLILELKDKMNKMTPKNGGVKSGSAQNLDEAGLALRALGFAENEIRNLKEQVRKNYPDKLTEDSESIVKLMLSFSGKI